MCVAVFQSLHVPPVRSSRRFDGNIQLNVWSIDAGSTFATTTWILMVEARRRLLVNRHQSHVPGCLHMCVEMWNKQPTIKSHSLGVAGRRTSWWNRVCFCVPETRGPADCVQALGHWYKTGSYYSSAWCCVPCMENPSINCHQTKAHLAFKVPVSFGMPPTDFYCNVRYTSSALTMALFLYVYVEQC